MKDVEMTTESAEHSGGNNNISDIDPITEDGEIGPIYEDNRPLSMLARHYHARHDAVSAISSYSMSNSILIHATGT